MAYYDPYEAGDDTQPKPATDQTPDHDAPAVTTSQTPQAPTTQAPSAPTTPTSSPYTMGGDFRYDTAGQTNTQLGQYANQLEGFDTGKLHDPSRTSAKYMFARVASRYAPTQQGFAQLMQDPEFQRLGMQSVGNGKIRLPNGDIIDVVRGFQSGGQAWQWGAETVNGQAQAQPPAQVPPYWQQPGYDPWAQYQQQQQAYQQQMQQWQQYQQQMQLYQAQQAMQQYYDWIGQEAALNQQPTSAPYVPPHGGANPGGMYSTPQGASPAYNGTGYNQGVNVYGAPGGASYADPVTLSLQQLGYGMPNPYRY
jgi:hypothetical protein